MLGPRILILTALRIEANAIAKKLNQKLPNNLRTLNFPHNNHNIELRVIGIAAIQPPPQSNPPPDAIIMAGLAGALDPKLKVGDLIIDDQSTWPNHPLQIPRVKIHTSRKLIESTAEKSNLFHQTNAAAVEMENAPVRDLAKKWGTPFLGLRSISDTANQSINPAILNCVDPFGKVKIGPLLKSLRHPSLIKHFVRLSRDSTTALNSLSSALASILQTESQNISPE